jgi:hypothetical protein
VDNVEKAGSTIVRPVDKSLASLLVIGADARLGHALLAARTELGYLENDRSSIRFVLSSRSLALNRPVVHNLRVQHF